MLILTRNIDQKIIIADNISVTVLGVKGNQVRIGVSAPENVSIFREELFQKIHQQTGNKKAR